MLPYSLYFEWSWFLSCSTLRVRGGGFQLWLIRQGINGFICRSARCGFIPDCLPAFGELCRLADETLFKVSPCSNPNDVGPLHRLLPLQSTASQNYNIRHRFHNLQIPARVNYLLDWYFITRMLYSNPY